MPRVVRLGRSARTERKGAQRGAGRSPAPWRTRQRRSAPPRGALPPRSAISESALLHSYCFLDLSFRLIVSRIFVVHTQNRPTAGTQSGGMLAKRTRTETAGFGGLAVFALFTRV